MIKKRKRLVFGVALLAVAFLCLAGILGFHFWDYWQVRAGLSRLDGAQVVRLYAESDIRLAQIHATLRLGDGSEILVRELTPESFRSKDSFRIGEMLGWRVAIQGCDCTYQQVDPKTGKSRCYEYLGTGFVVGKNGDLGGLVPFPVHTVQDLVDHYDGIVRVLESMPVYPQYGHLVAENGNELYYQRVPSELDPSDLPGSVLRDHTLEFVTPGCNP